jgi:outer membrane protein TolC
MRLWVKRFMLESRWILAAFLLLARPGFAAEANPAEAVKMTFAAALDRALSMNPNFALSKADVQRAEALVSESRAGAYIYRPIVTANAGLTQLDHDRKLGDPATVVTPATTLGANIIVTVPLVAPARWSQTWRAIDALNVMQSNAADVRRQVAIAVGRAYLSVVAQHRLIAVNQVAQDTANSHFAYAHGRLGAGAGNKVDDMRAQQEVATSAAQLESANAGLVKLQEALGVLLAVDRPVDVADEPTLNSSLTLDQSIKEAKDARTDLQALNTRFQTAHRASGDAILDYLPLLSLVVEPFVSTPATVNVPNVGFQAQLLLSVPIYDGGVRAGQQRERELVEAQSQISYDAALRQVNADVRASFETVRRNDQALRMTREAAALAKGTLDLTTLAYKAGAISNLEVIDAERASRDADSAVVIAEDNSRQARLDLLAASGRFPEGVSAKR